MIVQHGDCLELLRAMPDNSVDAIVTDPPYGLGKEPDAMAMLLDWMVSDHHEVKGRGFMGKEWDAFVPQPAVWRECLRVLKPGGHLLAFAGTRTQDLMALGLRIAGFEIRDMIAWVYGSGFPKSLDVSKAIDAQDAADARVARQLRFTEWMRSTGLTSGDIDKITSSCMGGHYTTAKSQPAVATREHFEMLRPHIGGTVPEWVEQLVDERTVESENMKRREVTGQQTKARSTNGSSALPTIGGKTEYKTWDETAAHTPAAQQWEGWGTALKPALEPITVARKPLTSTVAANVLQYGTGAINVDGCRVATEDKLAAGSGGLLSNVRDSKDYPQDNGFEQSPLGRWPANLLHDGAADPLLGHASRFFYCAKASKADRNYGCDNLPTTSAAEMVDRAEDSAGMNSPRAGAGRTTGARNTHPTVKPIALMRYLCRLVTPPGGTVLDPFAGSGTTGVGAILEGFNFIGIERDAHSVEIADARVLQALIDAATIDQTVNNQSTDK